MYRWHPTEWTTNRIKRLLLSGKKKDKALTKWPKPPDADLFVRFNGVFFEPSTGRVTLTLDGEPVMYSEGPPMDTVYGTMTLTSPIKNAFFGYSGLKLTT